MPKKLNKNEEKVSEGTSEEGLGHTIETLPLEVFESFVAPHLSIKDVFELSLTSKGMSFFCHHLLEKKAVKTLLSHVVKGEEAEALQMISVNPYLLRCYSEATAYSGVFYKHVTPFQAALLSHDVTLWKKMEPYFDKLTDGQIEKARQFKQLFPEGLPKQEPYDFSALIQVISNNSEADIQAVLRKENSDTPICKAIEVFRKNFTEMAVKETFFNPLHLLEALKVYDVQFDAWSWNKRDLFWRQVIGYTQRFIPACYAQAFCQGLYSIVENKNPLHRSLKFKYESVSYYPLTDSSGPGFDYGICSPLCGPCGAALVVRRAPRSPSLARGLINYIEQIRQNYLDLSVTCCVPGSPSRTPTH